MQPSSTAASRRFDLGSVRTTEALLLALAMCAFFSIALMQILLGATCAQWLVTRWRRGGPPLRAPLVLPLAGFLLVSLLSALNVRSFDAVRDVASSALAASVYLLVANVFTSVASARRAIVCVALAGSAASALGLFQAFRGGEELRISGTLGHYYTYAGVITLAGATTCAWMLLGAEGKRRALFAAAALLMTAALLQTQTRSAMLAFALGVGVALLAWKPRAVLLLPVVLALGYLLSPTHVRDRIRSMADPQDETVNERYEMWSNGLAMWRDHPLLGVGPEQVKPNYAAYRDPESPLAHVDFPGRIHNNVIHLAAERGTLAVALWIAFWLAWGVRTVRHLVRVRDGSPSVRGVVCGALSALLAFQGMGVFECNVLDSEVATLGYFLLGLPLGLEALNRPRGAESDPA